MAKIKGWLAKYGQVGFYNTVFMPGCFKENDGCKIPVVDKHEEPFTGKPIGTAELFLRDEGLYCEADVDLSKVDFDPKSFGFFGNHVERGQGAYWNQIKSVKIRRVSLLDVTPTKTSYVEEIEK